MVAIKYIYQVIEAVFTAVWGLVLIDILPLITIANIQNLEMFKTVDNFIKTLAALAGLAYFIYKFWEHCKVTTPHKRKMQELERRHKAEQIEQLEIDNEARKKQYNNEEN